MSTNDLDLASSINAMAESTTAAELVRRQGQTKKVKVLSERKLMEWISALLKQHLAAKEDSFSDSEKEALLKQTQEELARRIAREQAAEAERSKAEAALQEALAQAEQAKSGTSAEMDQAIAALKERLAQSEARIAEVQQDSYEMEDQLKEKLSLLSTTIGEKDKLRETVRRQMIRSGALIEGVLGLDATYYASRHAEQNPVSDDAEAEERFFHDFDIGAKVIESLSSDLERLRGITAQAAQAAPAGDRLLASDLEMLAQLKSGNLKAMDVAAPVENLIEALDGARTEAEAFAAAVAKATGSGRTQQSISVLPEAEGDPAEVLASATAVTREIAAELARSRGKITALAAIAEEADQARNAAEEELEQLKAAAPAAGGQDALRQLAQSLVERSKRDPRLSDAAADLAIELDDGGGDLAAGIAAFMDAALANQA